MLESHGELKKKKVHKGLAATQRDKDLIGLGCGPGLGSFKSSSGDPSVWLILPRQSFPITHCNHSDAT